MITLIVSNVLKTICSKHFVWWLVVSGGRVNLASVTPTWPEAKVFDVFFFKPVCFLKNPRRLPTQEKDIPGAEEAHIYVQTVPGSEEPIRDTYRPAVEVQRRRALWWLIPRLSLEWCRTAKEQIWSWNRAKHTGICARREERRHTAS